MIEFKNYEAWFITGSQHLYGESTLKKVAENSEKITKELNESGIIPVSIKFLPVMTDSSSITDICLKANNTQNCIGLITWMHTFSPAKMWISGLKILNKPFVHLHTQYNQDIPYEKIDMDFMNLNQSAHGGREFGFICSRMGIERKVIVGHWKNISVQKKLAIWMRAAIAWTDSQGASIARFGDNMREVAVTEGDKVEAQMKFGYSVNGYGVGDLVKFINEISDSEIDKLVEVYEESYSMSEDAQKGGNKHYAVRDAAQIELGMKAFLKDGGFKGFTTTFEDLHGLKQLPGIAVQRLMAEGYGFGAEGDWKTSALVRAMKVMSFGLDGGTSFMEDYTYHLEPGNMQCLGSHMLEICPTISNDKPRLEVHPLSIGGKNDPARLVFNVDPGDGINVSIIDMGNRFRLIVNKVEVVKPEKDFPKLPVARVMWIPKPNLEVGAASWIYAGGAHHTGFSKALSEEYMEDFASMAGIEYLLIDSETKLREFKNEIKWNDAYFSIIRK